MVNEEKRGLLANKNKATTLDNVNVLPSPGSTDCPSAAQLLEYGAVLGGSNNADVEEPLIQMSPSKNSLQNPYASYNSYESDTSDPTFRRQLRRKQMLTKGLVVVMAALLLSVGVYTLKSDTSTGPSSSSSSSQGHQDRAEILPTLTTKPLSCKHPVEDLNLPEVIRETGFPNQALFGPKTAMARPTNSWYQNLLLVHPDSDGNAGEPTEEQRVYPLPYIVDTVGPIAGMRVHSPTVKAGATDIQLIEIPQHGITLGAAEPIGRGKGAHTATSKKYTVTHMTPLGVTLEWNGTDSALQDDPVSYSTSIVRGMPYATMQYQNTRNNGDKDKSTQLLPTIVTEIPLGEPPMVDGTTQMKCHDSRSLLKKLEQPKTLVVQREVLLQFIESDYTWVAFVSRPVRVQCVTSASKKVGTVPFVLQFLDDLDAADGDSSANLENDFVVRIALMNDCTLGGNPASCGRGSGHHNDTELALILRRNVDLYPGPNSDMDYTFVPSKEGKTPSAVELKFDWNVQSMSMTQEQMSSSSSSDGELLMYALPHHQDLIADTSASSHYGRAPKYADSTEGHKVCRSTLLGKTCLVESNTWRLFEDFEHHSYTSFRAPRPPHHSSLPALVSAYQDDLNYQLPSYFVRGAGDTYFSGKMLAKLARILTIGEELSEMCSSDGDEESLKECDGLNIPSMQDSEFQDALAQLRSGVEIWVNGTGATPFVYDSLWGGLVSCGCNFDGKKHGGICKNKFPECPGFEDPGLNFGNAYYNDHHFHYGYHIYAAAAVAHFDPTWGRKFFEEIMLYIRDIANPSKDDEAFPTFRQKDWYQGSSWASGIAVSPLNGRNQESSSESIAAYEAIGLYGKEMVSAFENHDSEKAAVAQQIFDYGQLLTASEIRSAKKYYHVLDSPKERQYPKEYSPHVIGMLWTTMAQFQTWFGNKPFLAIGIQLLPLTAASEERDSLEWVNEMYAEFAESCTSNSGVCEPQGWSVLVMAMLATVGYRDDAVEQALELNTTEVFASAGGNGHSLTNTLWYLSTRPFVKHPIALNTTSVSNSTAFAKYTDEKVNTVDDDRYDAPEDNTVSKACPPCSTKLCRGKFNRCSVQNSPYLCIEGKNTGGCSRMPWTLGAQSCIQCCEVTYGCEN